MNLPAVPRQRGFAIVTAIFLLVVLAALGAFIVNVSSTQQIGSALDVQGVRAYHAAKSGIDWGIYQVTRNGNLCTDAPGATSFPVFTPPATATTMQGFAIAVTCTRYPDASGGPAVFEIEAIACNPPAAGPVCPGNPAAIGYVERRLRVTL